MFATGVENSIPTINNGRTRVDELEKCGHYDRYEEDFDCVEELGIRFLRYGPPLNRAWLDRNKYDWSFTDTTFASLKRRGIIPIVDLCHFGVPDWVGNFQNDDFPELFQVYARAFAERFPWVQLYTPVNEMFICATFSARYGWWNEQCHDDRSFVKAINNIVKANVLAMRTILEVRPDAIFIQSESSEYFHPYNIEAMDHARRLNGQRLLTLDLNYGMRVDSDMYEYLLDNGMTREQYHFFLDNNLKEHCIMGNDYYVTNEHRVNADGSTEASGEVFGYDEITREYHARYKLPVMHTETNLNEGPRGDEAVEWLKKEALNVLKVRENGVPIVGFTWYSITDQVDWDTALREDNGHVNPLGLYDLERKPRRIAEVYKKMIKNWAQIAPTASLCLKVPIDMSNVVRQLEEAAGTSEAPKEKKEKKSHKAKH
ncbi:MAG TPA: family 1 glycosylhydrolase [Polyangiaceae bacterium]|nr:family 1 glycosylhydrolase [Polyangiaceae bacterium]